MSKRLALCLYNIRSQLAARPRTSESTLVYFVNNPSMMSAFFEILTPENINERVDKCMSRFWDVVDRYDRYLQRIFFPSPISDPTPPLIDCQPPRDPPHPIECRSLCELFTRVGKEEVSLFELTIQGFKENVMRVILEELKEGPFFGKLRLRDCKFDNEITTELGNMIEKNSSLTMLDIKSCYITSMYDPSFRDSLKYSALKYNTTLTDLKFSCRNPSMMMGVSKLCEALNTNTTLRKLDLGSSRVDKMGTKAIVKLMETNSTITHLELGPIMWEEQTASDLDLVIQSLAKNSTLTTLNISKGGMFQKLNVPALGETLRLNETLAKLSLSRVEVTDSDIASLCHSLEFNTSLVELKLTTTSFSVRGTATLADFIEKNSVLEVLELEGRISIGPQEISLLAESLKTNSTLSTLRLSYGFDPIITEDGHWSLSNGTLPEGGASSLFDMLQTNTTLKILSLGGFMIGHLGVDALCNMLDSNITLKSLTLLLFNDEKDIPFYPKLYDSFKRNFSLETIVIEAKKQRVDMDSIAMANKGKKKRRGFF